MARWMMVPIMNYWNISMVWAKICEFDLRFNVLSLKKIHFRHHGTAHLHILREEYSNVDE